MARRKCRLADSEHKDVDLRKYAKIIEDTINKTVPGKNPKVFENYFSTEILDQREAVAIGRALAKIDELKQYGKTVTTFRLFDGKTYENEASTTPIVKKKKIVRKGGHL